MTSAERLQQQADRKRAHAIARAETYTPVDPATIDLSDPNRVFTSDEEEHLPEYMRDGNVIRRERGDLTNQACIDRVCELISRGVTETDARQYIGVSATEWGRWRVRNECNLRERIALAITLQHIAIADECARILRTLEYNRAKALTAYNVEMRTYNELLVKWRAEPEDKRGAGPAEPVYDGPSELDLKIAQARVQHAQWKLAAIAPDYKPKNETTVRNIHEEIRTAVTPQEAMKHYIHYIDAKPE